MPEIKALVKQLGADQETAFRANKALYEMVTRATVPDGDGRRKELATALAGELNARREPKKKEDKAEYVHTPRVRSNIARLLSFVAGDDQLAALTDALRDLDVREMARFALDFSTSPANTKTLIGALAEVGPEFRVGVIGALGRRHDPEALKILQDTAQNDTDDVVRIAAIEELAHFPDASSDAIIAKATSGCCRSRALVARVHLAETLGKAGKTDEARKIYRAINNSDADPHHKCAAEIGLKAMA